MSSLNSSLSLLINLMVDAYIYLLLVRIILQNAHASWYNPISQFTYKLSEPLAKPMRRFMTHKHHYDSVLIVLVFIIQYVGLLLSLWLSLGMFPNILGILLVSLGKIGMKVVNIYFYATIIAAIMSWFPALQQGPVAEAIYLITAPLFNLARRYIPPLAGIDFSPFIIIIVLMLTNTLVFAKIILLGMGLILHL